MSDAVDTIWRRLRFTPMFDLIRGRVSGRLDLQRLLRNSDLPAPARQRVADVVRATRLWRSEQIDVAEELIAHFADGIDAGESPEQLVAAFGDPRNAAKLIRRAKIRQRPAAWHALRWTRRCLAALVLYYLLLTVWFFTGSPKPDVDYLSQMNANAAATPEDRAWPLYREALIEIGYNKPDTKIGAILLRGQYPQSERWAEASALVAAHQSALEKIQQATARPKLGYVVAHGVWPEDRELFGSSFPTPHQNDGFTHVLIGALLLQGGPLSTAGHLLAVDGFAAIERRDGERIAQDTFAILRVAEHASETKCVIGALRKIHLRTVAMSLFSHAIREHPELFTREHLLEFTHRLPAREAFVRRAVQDERLWFNDLIQRIYSDDGNGDGRITPQGIRLLIFDMGNRFELPYGPLNDTLILAASPGASMRIASRRDVVAKQNDLMQQVDRLFDIYARDMTDESAETEIKKWDRATQLRYLPIFYAFPTLSGARGHDEGHQSIIEGALVGVTLELYRRDHGDWPKALNDLSPRYLPHVPEDRATGGPLHYQIIDGKPIVYSVGLDHNDDGGRPAIKPRTDEPDHQAAGGWLIAQGRRHDPTPDGDWVIWPIQIK